MASTSHSGQLRNSSSPSVIALSSTKASSTAAAKPRFRSRTGCWTCRRRKVKCDERGRNPETVAYGGPLSSCAGCKRCEDSGRPCHGYGAQPPSPSGPLVAQYPPANVAADPLLSSAPFYSFSSQAHDNTSLPLTFPTGIGNIEAIPAAISPSLHWTQPFERSFSGNQAVNYGFGLPRHTQSSSTSTEASIVPAEQQSSVQLSPVDLRRYSVPSYPTWQKCSSSRNNEHYSSGHLYRSPFSMDRTSPAYEDMDQETLPRTTSSPMAQKPHSHGNNYTGIPTVPNQSLASNDMSSYNNELKESDKHYFSFGFGRPHTSSGVTLSYDNPQPHQTRLKTNRSPIMASSKGLECITDSRYTDSTPLPTIGACNSSGNVWSAQQPSARPLAVFRSMSSTICNHSASPAHTPLFSAQVTEPVVCQTTENFKNAGSTDISIFPSATAHDIPYDMYAIHPSLPTEAAPSGSPADVPSNKERCASLQSSERPFHLVNIDPTHNKTFPPQMMSHDSHETLHGSSYSYVQTSPFNTHSEFEKDQSPGRRESSSSSPCSLTLQEHNSSVKSAVCHAQPGPSDKWSAHCLIPSLENQQYDLQSILHHKNSGFQNAEVYEDDSPTSTAPSNTSGAIEGVRL